MEFLKLDPFYVLTGFIGLIVWFTRLEAKNNRNEDDIRDLKIEIVKMKESYNSLEVDLMNELTAVKILLARIDGKMESKKGE